MRKQKSALELLSESGLSRTKVRLEILDLLLKRHGPFTSEQIHVFLKTHEFDRATIFRSVAALESENLIQRVMFSDGVARFEIKQSGHHHHHIVCRKCQHVEIVDKCIGSKLDALAEGSGFSEISHMLEFTGICRGCKDR